MIFLTLYLLAGLFTLIFSMCIEDWAHLYSEKVYDIKAFSLAGVIIFLLWPVELFLKFRNL